MDLRGCVLFGLAGSNDIKPRRKPDDSPLLADDNSGYGWNPAGDPSRC